MKTRIILLLVVVFLVLPANARAVPWGGIVDTFSPSARGAALADGGGVVPEGPFAMRWNPAGVAVDQPVSIGATYSELATAFVNDVWILHLGGVAQIGPVGLGVYYARLDQGEQERQGTGTPDPDDPEAGSEVFTPTEHALRFGVAVDIIDLIDVDTGEDVVDLCFGLGAKRIEVNLAPASVTQDLGQGGGAGEASAWTMDAGLLLRYGTFVGHGSTGADQRSYIGARASVVYDCLGGQDLTFIDADQSDPLPARVRIGAALEAGLLPRADDSHLLWMILLYEHLNSHVDTDDWKVNSVGLELTVANMVVLRGGLLDDALAESTGETYGAGLRLFPREASWGVAVDYANRPDRIDTDRLHLFTATVALDVFD